MSRLFLVALVGSAPAHPRRTPEPAMPSAHPNDDHLPSRPALRSRAARGMGSRGVHDGL